MARLAHFWLAFVLKYKKLFRKLISNNSGDIANYRSK